MGERIASDFKNVVGGVCFGYRLSLTSPLGLWMKIEHYFVSVADSDVSSILSLSGP